MDKRQLFFPNVPMWRAFNAVQGLQYALSSTIYQNKDKPVRRLAMCDHDAAQLCVSDFEFHELS